MHASHRGQGPRVRALLLGFAALAALALSRRVAGRRGASRRRRGTGERPTLVRPGPQTWA